MYVCIYVCRAASGHMHGAQAHLIGCWQNLGAVCFWQPIPDGLNLVVAVLRDSLCVVPLLPYVADCCMPYTVCKIERFVLTIIIIIIIHLTCLSISPLWAV